MVLNDVFDRFAKKTPVSVMARAMMENVLKPESLDSIFLTVTDFGEGD